MWSLPGGTRFRESWLAVKKKVCLLTCVHPTALDVRVFHREAKTLAANHYHVVLVAQHPRNDVVTGVRIVGVPKPRNRFRRMLGSAGLLKVALQENAFIYHFHDPELIPLGLFLKLVKRRKVIYDVHEDFPKSVLSKAWIPRSLRSTVGAVLCVVERVSSAVFDAVVVAADDIARHFPRRARVTILRNFPFIATARTTSKRFRRSSAILICVGGMSRDRGIEEMVRAVDIVRYPATLLLIGSFTDASFEEELRRTASKRVEFMGQVPHERVFEYLDGADVGLILFHPIPNHLACCWRNNKLFEYMARGLPIIGSNFPLWRELIEGHRCGICVDPLNVGEIAGAVEYLIENPEQAERMGENGRRLIIERYNWEMESRKLVALYRELGGEPRQPKVGSED